MPKYEYLFCLTDKESLWIGHTIEILTGNPFRFTSEKEKNMYLINGLGWLGGGRRKSTLKIPGSDDSFLYFRANADLNQ